MTLIFNDSTGGGHSWHCTLAATFAELDKSDEEECHCMLIGDNDFEFKPSDLNWCYMV